MSNQETPYDEKTTEVLECAAKTLGGGSLARSTIMFIYALGRLDGGLTLAAKREPNQGAA